MYTTADEAVRIIKSGSHVFIQTAAAAPQQLVKAMTARAPELRDVSIYQLHTEGLAPYGDPQYEGIFHVNCFFVGANLRKAVQEGRAQYIPVFLSEIPGLFRKKAIEIDYALIHVSPPDAHGFCSLGVSVDIAPSVLANARHVIAQVNPNMPRTHGNGFIHVSKIEEMVAVSDPIPEVFIGEPDETTLQIAKHVASLVEDGATLQMGIGSIPDAVLRMLKNHKKLGIHTEMFSDGVVNLIESGAVTGEMKKKHPHKVVSSFLLGTKRLYDYVNDNPLIEMLDIGYVNETHVIRQNPKVTAINSALEVDLTGQVCADSIGSRIYSGVGGQIDFIRGASLSEGGKPIIAMPSATGKGTSKIVSSLKPGAGVVTTRANVHYVVTEYGIAYLYGKNLKQRAAALINIAHPDHRARLEEEAFAAVKSNGRQA
ncbi:MAG: acetyl-CoA hydrolase/transferase family protein [Bacteroidetes bacterium]|nr:acetyl-CoA hydrolase/transferase family protein [Bacteroidota bacterium]MBS1974000.1 acetyl-CoA hydrolase/transferase family protein [Bacteroidota bacterium]